MRKLLIIGYVWPEPNSSAAGSRMMQLIHFFLSEKYKIVFATTATETVHMVNLAQIGVKTQKIELNNSSFNDFVKDFQPNIVLFDRFMMEEQFGWRVSEVCPTALKILDTEDLHFLRKARQEAFKSQKSLTPSLLQSENAKREIASIYRCDLSLIISEAETKLLTEHFAVPESLLVTLPFMLEAVSSEAKNSLPSFEDRKHFISIGNFRHAPNWNAVVILKQKIWPLIKEKLPEAELHIYGAYPSQKVTDLNNAKEGFLVKGWTPDAEKVVKNAKVLLAPLQFGAGLKGKLVEAMQNATPSVTTTCGAEGMHGDLGWNGFIEDDHESFAQKAVYLYSEKNIWQQSQHKGFKILEAYFLKDRLQEMLKNKIEKTRSNLENHRSKNFTGAMLQHHAHMSSKYLSKYIEIKNKQAKD